MIERFKLDDTAYIRWSNSHRDGFVLHKKGRDFSLHRSQCGHIYEMGADYALTRAEKICSSDRGELVALAVKQAGRRPVMCETCEP